MILFTAPNKPIQQVQEAWNLSVKMEALALRFYQRHHEWYVTAGDLYCISRAGLALFIVVKVADDLVWFRNLMTDDGKPVSVATTQPGCYGHHEFLHGGFAPCRIPIPTLAWSRSVFREELTGPTCQSLLNPATR